MKESLLDEIARNIGCNYLSDIKMKNIQYSCIKGALDSISEGEYSLEGWTDAIKYITNDANLVFENEIEAKEYLADFYKAKNSQP